MRKYLSKSRLIEIINMHGNKCDNCESNESLQVHHIVPVLVGGTNRYTNLCVLCYECHMKLHGQKHYAHNHNEAVKEGMRKAKDQGVKFGRKANRELCVSAIVTYGSIFNEDGISNKEICKRIGVKETCIAKYQKEVIENFEKGEWPYSFVMMPKKRYRKVSKYDRTR